VHETFAEHERPAREQGLTGGVPTRRPRAAFDRSTERQRTEGETTEEGCEHCQHGHELVTESEAELLGPDDLVAEARKAGQ